MNWSRYKVLWIVGGLSLTLAAAGLFWALKSSGTNQKLESDIVSLDKELDVLAAQEPFPSQASLKTLENAQQNIAATVTELKREIREGQINPPRMARTRFADYVRSLVPNLQEKAKASTTGGEQGVILQDPEFGLGAYIQGELPEASRMKSLMLEVETMAHVAGLLFDSGISEFVSFELVEDSKDEDAAPGRLGRPLGNPLGGPRPGGALAGALSAGNKEDGGDKDDTVSLPERIRKERDRLFTVMRFKVHFRVYEEFYWNVLNSFQEDSNLFVVESFQVTNANEKIWPKGLSIQRGGAGARRDRSPQPNSRVRPGRGVDLEALMNNMDVDEEEAAETEVELIGLSQRRARFTGGGMIDVTLHVALYRLNDQPASAEVN